MGRGSSVGISTEVCSGTVRESNAGMGEIFPTRPDLAWGSHFFLYSGYIAVKPSGSDLDHPFTSITEVKERVELYIYSICVFMASYMYLSNSS